MSFLFSKKKEGVSLIFDIGSGNAGAALVHFKVGEKPNVMYTTREAFRHSKEISGKQLIELKSKALQNVAEKILKDGLPYLREVLQEEPVISEIICFFGAPWYSTKTVSVTLQKLEPFVISESLIQTVVKERESEFIHSFDTEAENPSVAIIEEKIIHARLGGYEVEDFFLKKTTELSFSLFMSVLQKEVMDAVRNTLEPFFHSRKITFHSFLLPYFSTIRDIFSHKESFLLVDVTGEVTEITLIKRGVPIATSTYPVGRLFFLRHVAKVLDVSPQIAASFIKVHLEGRSEKSASTNMETYLIEATEKWRESFLGALSTLTEEAFLPKTFFLTAEEDVIPLFRKILAEEKLDISGLGGEQLEIVPLNQNRLAAFCRFEKKARLDSFFAIEALFLNKLKAMGKQKDF